MQKKDLIKYALIAGGAYLLYEYLKSAGYLNFGTTALLPTGTTTAPGTGLTVTPPTNTQPAQVVNPPSNLPPSNPSIAPVVSVSTNPGDGGPTGRAMVSASGGKSTLNLDEWSYYNQQVTGNVISPGLFSQIVMLAASSGINRNGLTAGQFQALLAAAQATGMSGLGNFGLGDFWDFSGRSGRYIN